MNQWPRQKLCELIATYGETICEDAQRCADLLQQTCRKYRRELFLLLLALNERVPTELLSASRETPPEELLMKLATRLRDRRSVPEEAAQWAVESWALALQVISREKVHHASGKRYGIFGGKKSLPFHPVTMGGSLLIIIILVLGIAYALFFSNSSAQLEASKQVLQTSSVSSISPAPSPANLYETARTNYTRGNYFLALSGFQAYLQQEPLAKHAREVHYWLGEIYYHLGDYRQAIREFDKVLTEPKGLYVSQALLKKALAHLELHETGQAKKILHRLETSLADISENTLSRLPSLPTSPEQGTQLQSRVGEEPPAEGLVSLSPETGIQPIQKKEQSVLQDQGSYTDTEPDLALQDQIQRIQAEESTPASAGDQRDLQRVKWDSLPSPFLTTASKHTASVQGQAAPSAKTNTFAQETLTRIQKALQANKLFDVQVSIDAENNLTLTGRVKNTQEEATALAVARAQPGINKVINHLTNRTKVTIENILRGSFE